MGAGTPAKTEESHVKTKVVYIHPKGRYEVVERTGRNGFGELYRIREAFLTPDKDRRGQFHAEAGRACPGRKIVGAKKCKRLRTHSTNQSI